MSFAEIRLVLERAGRQRSLDLLAATRSRYLASAAKWSKEIGKLFNDFSTEILRSIDPAAADEAAKPKKLSRGQLMSLFASLGIQQQKTAMRPASPAQG